jgi:ElaA protein
VIEWQWKRFDEITAAQMHEMLKLRQDVFILEQQCLYPDIDSLDPLAHHLFGYASDGDNQDALAAYLRVFTAGIKFPEVSIGRVLIDNRFRGKGSGKQLISKALQKLDQDYPKDAIKISAQVYLEAFYVGFGFTSISDAYDEDGIMHIDMLRTKSHS